MAIRGMLFAVVLVAASIARAEASPMDVAVCGSSDIVAQMAAPTGRFAPDQVIGQCAKLCKTTASACKTAVRDIASCQDTALKMFQTILLKNCERVHMTDSDKTCKQGVIADFAASRSASKTDAKQNALNCDSWGSQCQATCQ